MDRVPEVKLPNATQDFQLRKKPILTDVAPESGRLGLGWDELDLFLKVNLFRLTRKSAPFDCILLSVCQVNHLFN